MKKSDLIDKLATVTKTQKKQVKKFLDTMVDIIIKEVKSGNKVNITGLITIGTHRRYSRNGVNPQNPSQKMIIPEVIVPKFRAGKTFKDALKGIGKK